MYACWRKYDRVQFLLRRHVLFLPFAIFQLLQSSILRHSSLVVMWNSDATLLAEKSYQIWIDMLLPIPN